MSFIEALVRLRICLFRHVFCRRKSNKTCHFSTVFTLLLLTMVSVSHIYCRQRARFHCVCLNHRECLIWVKFVKIPKQTFENQLTVINPCSTHALFKTLATWQLVRLSSASFWFRTSFSSPELFVSNLDTCLQINRRLENISGNF